MPLLLSLLAAPSIEAQYPTTESGTPLFCYAETTSGEIVDLSYICGSGGGGRSTTVESKVDPNKYVTFYNDFFCSQVLVELGFLLDSPLPDDIKRGSAARAAATRAKDSTQKLIRMRETEGDMEQRVDTSIKIFEREVQPRVFSTMEDCN